MLTSQRADRWVLIQLSLAQLNSLTHLIHPLCLSVSRKFVRSFILSDTKKTLSMRLHHHHLRLLRLFSFNRVSLRGGTSSAVSTSRFLLTKHASALPGLDRQTGVKVRKAISCDKTSKEETRRNGQLWDEMRRDETMVAFISHYSHNMNNANHGCKHGVFVRCIRPSVCSTFLQLNLSLELNFITRRLLSYLRQMRVQHQQLQLQQPQTASTSNNSSHPSFTVAIPQPTSETSAVTVYMFVGLIQHP